MSYSETFTESVNFAILKIFSKLRNFSGKPPVFWKLYIETIVKICKAKTGIIASGGTGTGGKILQPVALWPITTAPKNSIVQEMLSILRDNDFRDSDTISTITGTDTTFAAIKINIGNDTDCIALLQLGDNYDTIIEDRKALIEYIHDLPAIYQIRMSVAESSARQHQLSSILDLMVLLNENDRFLSAAMTFCNELAMRFHCDRVSLGWLKNKYIKLQAISHSDDFEKKMDEVRKLELAMEEAFEQNCEICFPASTDTKCIVHDHEQFVRSQDVQYICSIPMRSDNDPIAVCTLERNTNAFSENEVAFLHLTCDQAMRRLNDLKNNDKWIGALAIDKLKKTVKKLIGFEHTGAKLIGISVTLILAGICFIPITYRLESPVILRTDSVAYLTAPVRSHIEKVTARVGDNVRKGQELLQLDKNELLLEEARLEAEKNRYQRESEKARAVDELAEMQIAEALKNQAIARLKSVQFQLSQATITAPFDGIIVEGDQLERIGSPIEQGDVLFKIARIENMYAEMEVPETEIHNVKINLSGEIALASNPQNTHDITLFRIEPAAVTKEEGNVFIVHGEFSQAIPSWWRPGMTGVSKLKAGKKTILWILTHRTIDFLRLKLWW